jgi:hypothetical protein
VANNTTYCWGEQRLGELGIGLSGIQTTPNAVPNMTFVPPVITADQRIRQPGTRSSLKRAVFSRSAVRRTGIIVEAGPACPADAVPSLCVPRPARLRTGRN